MRNYRHYRPGLFGAAAVLALAASLSACGSAPPPPRLVPLTKVAPAWLRAHPVPPVPGMTAGIVTEQLGDVAWFCHHGRGSLAGNCGYWAGILLTAGGQTVTFTCGRVVDASGTPLPASSWADCTDPGYVPEPGDYVYVPSSLEVTPGHDVRVIRLPAIQVWDSGPPAMVLQGGS
jgi:hypothetical protein